MQLGHPSRAVAQRRCSLAPTAMNDPRDVKAELPKADEPVPAQATQWSLLGVALLQQGKCDEAADAFRRSLHLDANDALAWSNLGAAEWAQGRLNEADDAYAKSVSI